MLGRLIWLASSRNGRIKVCFGKPQAPGRTVQGVPGLGDVQSFAWTGKRMERDSRLKRAQARIKPSREIPNDTCLGGLRSADSPLNDFASSSVAGICT